jgi:IS5 family transposase
VVDWSRVERVLSGLRQEGPGRPGYRPLLLFKALLLQAWYGLSDADLEFRLGDSLAFGREPEAKDPDAAFARRQGKPGSTYGYKAHVGVDQGSGLVRAVITTPANINDTVPADDLIRGDEAAVYADKAYDTHARRARLKLTGTKARLMRRPNKHHALTPRQQQLNNLIARRRAAVETTFATWKRRMGLIRARYVGLARVTGQILMVAMAFNLRRVASLTA